MTTTQDERRGWTSASSAQADLLCKGRHIAQRGLPDLKDKDAEGGSAIHDALAKQDPKGLTVEQVETYDACMEVEKLVVEQVFGKDIASMEAKPIREQRFWIKFKDDANTEHSAQIDCGYRYKTRALIIEYKTLQGDVPGSPQNLQLRDQAVLFDHNTPMLSEIVVAVIQPWVTRKPQLALYKRDDLNKSRNEIYARIIASNNPESPRTPGEVQCKFCRSAVAGKCPEYNKWAGGLVTTDQNLLDVPSANWTPEQRRLFCDRLPIAQKWLDSCKASMKELLKADPAAIPGYSLSAGSKTETIINPQAVFETFSQRGGSLNQFMQCLSVGKGDLKKVLAEVTQLKGKKLDKELELVIGDNHIIGNKEGSLTKE